MRPHRPENLGAWGTDQVRRLLCIRSSICTAIIPLRTVLLAGGIPTTFPADTDAVVVAVVAPQASGFLRDAFIDTGGANTG
jgi:hypothetical protein